MSGEFPTRYDFKTIENYWYPQWEKSGLFHSEPDPDKLKFSLVIPPPNVTGYLHIGHALDTTYQDVIARWKRQCGYNVCWIPGTDHAGIATQNVVERELLSKWGVTREQLGREEFLKKVWEWKTLRGTTIINQLKKIGCSCDWGREKFTMESDMSEWVKRTFQHLYRDNLVYRDFFPVNWCPRCETALANDEVEHQESKSSLYYLKYYFTDDPTKYLIVATTRPETVFGDVAVAFHKGDDRYKQYEGKTLIAPVSGQIVKLISDTYPDPQFGTGLVKITPAHDKNDFQVGKRHGLENKKILSTKAVLINTNNTKYDNLDRFEARKLFIKELAEHDLIEKIQDYNNNIGCCYRCHTQTEVNLSYQWFVRMEKMAKQAILMVESKQVQITPPHHEKIFNHWLSNCEDWCISRQIWWGHSVPIHYCDNCHNPEINTNTTCTVCKSDKFTPDPDVLDTWFSSWLWSFAVFGEEERSYYFPIDVLITGSDILFFWVARMMMASGELLKSKPFDKVFLHGIVRDTTGEKMSKSKGNTIDPLDIIDKYGADAMRFTLLINTPFGGDTQVSEKSFELGTTFCTKLWNSVRFCVQNIKSELDLDYETNSLDGLDYWIMDKFNKATTEYEQLLHRYCFSEALTLIRNFYWDDFCNGYLELCKFKINSVNTQKILLSLVRKTLIVLHPIIPFITEQLWTETNKLINTETPETIMMVQTPALYNLKGSVHDPSSYDVLWTLVQRIRSAKVKYGTQTGSFIITVPKTDPSSLFYELVSNNLDLITQIPHITSIEINTDTQLKKFDTVYDDYILTIVDNGDLNYKNLINNLQTKLKSLQLSTEKINKFYSDTKNEKKKGKFLEKLEENKDEIDKTMKELSKY